MINFIKSKDIFQSGCPALVNPVNTGGYDNAGLALFFQKNFPKNSEKYREHCNPKSHFFGNPKGGDVFVTREVQTYFNDSFFIFNAFTKENWQNPSKIEWIRLILDKIAKNARALSIDNIAIPALGCGLGGLDWNEVKKEMEISLLPVRGINFWVYEPI